MKPLKTFFAGSLMVCLSATAMAQPQVYDQENTGSRYALKKFKAPEK